MTHSTMNSFKTDVESEYVPIKSEEPFYNVTCGHCGYVEKNMYSNIATYSGKLRKIFHCVNCNSVSFSTLKKSEVIEIKQDVAGEETHYKGHLICKIEGISYDEREEFYIVRCGHCKNTFNRSKALIDRYKNIGNEGMFLTCDNCGVDISVKKEEINKIVSEYGECESIWKEY